MRRILLFTMLLVAVTAACGDDAESTTTAAPAPTTTTTKAPPVTSTSPPAAAVAIGQHMLDAFLTGDAGAWRDRLATDSSMFDEPGWVPDDFDGDGLKSIADVVQHRIALGPALGRQGSGTCELTDGTGDRYQVHCSYTLTDRFYKAAGYAEVSEVTGYTIVNGSVAAIESIESDGEAWGARMDAIAAYEQWVNEAHPDRYGSVFHDPCCEINFVRLPETIPVHEELMAAYFAATD